MRQNKRGIMKTWTSMGLKSITKTEEQKNFVGWTLGSMDGSTQLATNKEKKKVFFFLPTFIENCK